MLDILEQTFLYKYAVKGADGKPTETRYQVYNRVAQAVVMAEKPEDRELWARCFSIEMQCGRFMPGGRILSNAGTSHGMLLNCFVVPILEDSRRGIFKALQDAMELQAYGGGVGYDFTPIRPRGSRINGTGGTAIGPCGFLTLFDQHSQIINAANNRPAANMGILRYDHPDIFEFINFKRRNVRFLKALRLEGLSIEDAKEVKARVRFWTRFNVSIAIDAAFLEAVEHDGYVLLQHPSSASEHDKRVVKARMIWDAAVEAQHECGDPGMINFGEVNDKSNSRYFSGPIRASNPCQPAWATVLTPNGIRRLGDVSVGDTIWSGQRWTKVIAKVATGEKMVMAYHTRTGVFYGTEQHRVVQGGEKVEVCEAEAIDICRGVVVDPGEVDQHDVVAGLMVGDGAYVRGKGINALIVGAKDSSYYDDPVSAMLLEELSPGYSTGKGYQQWIVAGWGYNCEVLPRTFNRVVPDRFRFGSTATVRGFLRGLYSANGSVLFSANRNVRRVVLKATSFKVVEAAQEMLSSLGIASYYTANNPNRAEWHNGSYVSRESFNLIIGTACGRELFRDLVGFIQPYKSERLDAVVEYDQDRQAHDKSTFEITDIEEVGVEPVFDITVEAPEHTYWTGGLLVSNCGEQMLPGYDNCCLGALNLTKFVSHDNEFDFVRFEESVGLAVRFLDNVVEVNHHVLPETKDVASRSRRVGLGVFGFGDMLAMRGIRYDSDEGLLEAASIATSLRNSSYSASSILASERGCFPAFESERFLASGFCQTLPANVLDTIKSYGMRNVCVNTLAPTGSIAYVSDNVSSGIEPIYALEYQRSTVKESSGSDGGSVMSPAWRDYQDRNPILGASQPKPDYFRTALEISPEAHVRMLATWQQFIDSSVSKTVNLPREATTRDVSNVYTLAFKLKCKAVSVYRDGSLDFQILNVSSEPAKTYDVTVGVKTEDLNRVLHNMEVRPNGRRKRPDVVRSETFRLNTPQGKVYLVVGKDDDNDVFETLTVADGVGHGWCNALGRLISVSLQHGVPLPAVIRTLVGIQSGQAQLAQVPGQERQVLVHSAPDAIGQALRQYLPTDEPYQCSDPDTCHGEKVKADGCLKCLTCGWTKCG